jgi:hypothetical protein
MNTCQLDNIDEDDSEKVPNTDEKVHPYPDEDYLKFKNCIELFYENKNRSRHRKIKLNSTPDNYEAFVKEVNAEAKSNVITTSYVRNLYFYPEEYYFRKPKQTEKIDAILSYVSLYLKKIEEQDGNNIDQNNGNSCLEDPNEYVFEDDLFRITHFGSCLQNLFEFEIYLSEIKYTVVNKSSTKRYIKYFFKLGIVDSQGKIQTTNYWPASLNYFELETYKPFEVEVTLDELPLGRFGEIPKGDIYCEVGFTLYDSTGKEYEYKRLHLFL